MANCPHCGTDLTYTLRDVLRKTDYSPFECDKCKTDLIATATRTISVDYDKTAKPKRRPGNDTCSKCRTSDIGICCDVSGGRYCDVCCRCPICHPERTKA
jgi:hypothetical protein